MSRPTPTLLIQQLVAALQPHDLGLPLIRIGGSKDGGYLIPDDLQGISRCFSPGVGDSATFENALLPYGIRSSLADYSVAGPPSDVSGCDFTKKFVGASTSDTMMTMDDWVNASPERPADGDLILQMDIEGAEYETLLATSVPTLRRFRIIVLELHKLHHLSHPLYFRLVSAALSRVLEHFEVAHLHPNNVGGLARVAGVEIPRLLEVTLLRKDRVRHRLPVTHLPHPLDVPNVADRRDVCLPETWWKASPLRHAS